MITKTSRVKTRHIARTDYLRVANAPNELLLDVNASYEHRNESQS